MTIYRLSVSRSDGLRGSTDYSAIIKPNSLVLEGVFDSWGMFAKPLKELRDLALAEPTDKFEWSSDPVIVWFDDPEAVLLFDAFALVDGEEVEPTRVDRSNFIALIDQWLVETNPPEGF